MRLPLWMACATLLLVACARINGQPPAGPLMPSLQATAVGDSVHFVLQVTNVSERAVELNFRSGQSYDFVVQDEAGRELWRWSADMMFTQALRRERVEPGATLVFEESWRPPTHLRGRFVAVGQLTASDHPVEQRAYFRL
jgi:hypothetical protein